MSNGSLEELLEQYKMGKREAFVQIYQQEVNKVYAIALSYLKNETEAEDMTQQTFLKFVEKIDSIQHVHSWLEMVTKNACLDQIKKKKAELFSSFDTYEQEDWFEESIEDTSIEFRPDIAMERQEIILATREILETLPDVQRICIHMKEYENLSYQEIADLLEIPLSKVKNSIFAAKSKIKEQMQAKKLFSVAPITFFIWMYRETVEACELPSNVSADILSCVQKNISDAAQSIEIDMSGEDSVTGKDVVSGKDVVAGKNVVSSQYIASVKRGALGTLKVATMGAKTKAVLVGLALVTVVGGATGGQAIRSHLMERSGEQKETERVEENQEGQSFVQNDADMNQSETDNKIENADLNETEDSKITNDDSDITNNNVGNTDENETDSETSSQNADYLQSMNSTQQEKCKRALQELYSFMDQGRIDLEEQSYYNASAENVILTSDREKIWYLWYLVSNSNVIDEFSDKSIEYMGEACLAFSQERLNEALLLLVNQEFDHKEDLVEYLKQEKIIDEYSYVNYIDGYFVMVYGRDGELPHAICEVDKVSKDQDDNIEITGIEYFCWMNEGDDFSAYKEPRYFRAVGYANEQSPLGITLTGIEFDEHILENVQSKTVSWEEMWEMEGGILGNVTFPGYTPR